MTRTPPDLAEIRGALATVLDPEIRRPVTELDMIEDVVAGADGDVLVRMRLTIVGCPAADRIEREVREAVERVPGVTSARVELGVMTPEQRDALTRRLRGDRPAAGPFGPGGLTRVIAVTSGKGGVGKSTVTANLAVALADRDLRVGIVDADVYGFSVPGLMGLIDEDGAAPSPTRVNDLILPPVALGVKVISIGMFLPTVRGRDAAVSWRGPMLHRTLQQFLRDVWFGDLDVLLLDLPPGTGDVALSLGQLLPNAEVVVVTTPQPAAADVAERSAVVARQTGQRVIGVVENMAAFVDDGGRRVELFGAGGGEEVARRLSSEAEAVPLLGSVPVSIPLREAGDAGLPVVRRSPTDPAAVALSGIADRLAVRARPLGSRGLPLTVRS